MNDLGLNDVRMSGAVAQAGTLTAATRERRLTTSTVSRALTRLEKHLGVFLCATKARASAEFGQLHIGCAVYGCVETTA
jgi:DNA-binding transcriptional LysR family regulator